MREGKKLRIRICPIPFHRLLDYNVHSVGFKKTQADPLSCDLLIIDETSMVDTQLMYQLPRAVPDAAFLILIGDVELLQNELNPTRNELQRGSRSFRVGDKVMQIRKQLRERCV